MRSIGVVLILVSATAAGPARAGATFESLFSFGSTSPGYPSAVSTDGNSIVGNTPPNGVAFRWTQAGGYVELGMAPTPSPNGLPGISSDGTRVAATILGADSTYAASGLWSLGSGWEQLMPPGAPPNQGLIDRSTSTVYGLSGDGKTVVGLYWLTTGRAHAYSWTQAGGGVDLGTTFSNRSSRANGVNHDGSVVVGWDEDATGPRLPAAWVNGTLSVLSTIIPGGEAQATTPVGDVAVGYEYNPVTTVRECARWVRTGGTWSATQYLGSVPGTEGSAAGINVAEGVSADGGLIVGYCSFDGSPFNTTGFVWTDSTGTIDVNTFLGNYGISVGAKFLIQSCTGVTPDGTKIIGYGQDLVHNVRQTFRITIPRATTGVGTGPAVAAGLALAAPSPNPSRGPTRLSFTLAEAGDVDLSIFDAAGRRVATPEHASLPAGEHTTLWNGHGADGRAIADGVYWARLTTAAGVRTRRMVCLH